MRTASPPGDSTPRLYYQDRPTSASVSMLADAAMQEARQAHQTGDIDSCRSWMGFAINLRGLADYGDDALRTRVLLGETSEQDRDTINECGRRVRHVLREAREAHVVASDEPKKSSSLMNRMPRMARRESHGSGHSSRRTAKRVAASSSGDPEPGEPSSPVGRGLSQHRFPNVGVIA